MTLVQAGPEPSYLLRKQVCSAGLQARHEWTLYVHIQLPAYNVAHASRVVHILARLMKASMYFTGESYYACTMYTFDSNPYIVCRQFIGV
jgi:hypothetical protein